MRTKQYLQTLQNFILTLVYLAFLAMSWRFVVVFLYRHHWKYSIGEFQEIVFWGFLIDTRTMQYPVLIYLALLGGSAVLKKYGKIFRLILKVFLVLLGALITIGQWARLFYYHYFRVVFDHFLFDTQVTDTKALLKTLHYDFSFWWLLPLLILSFLVAIGGLLRIQKLPFLFHLPDRAEKITFRSLLALMMGVVIFWNCALYNIVFSQNNNLKDFNWVYIMSLPVSDFAREMILDPWSGYRRAQYHTKKFVKKVTVDEISKEEFQKKMEPFSELEKNGFSKLTGVDDFWIRSAQGNTISKPSHIFIIVGESYSQWPLLPEYRQLEIAPSGQEIINDKETIWVKNFLPASNHTRFAISAIVTGLNEESAYAKETVQQVYGTSLASQLSQLGYESHFWYSGDGEWGNFKKMTLAQGFQSFHGSGDPGIPGIQERSNFWGLDDHVFLPAVVASHNFKKSTVNVILTGSNHNPFPLDVDSYGFPREQVRKMLPEDRKTDEELLTQLGHFWYSDRELGRFVQAMKKKYPDALFIITGDHADRITNKPVSKIFDRETVPFIIHGQGIQKSLISQNHVGSHVQIIPTLIELIAPRGFRYYSVLPSMTDSKSTLSASDRIWITSDMVGFRNSDSQEYINIVAPEVSQGRQILWENDYSYITLWRVHRGNQLPGK